jgi:translation initiation factor 2 subunit 1
MDYPEKDEFVIGKVVQVLGYGVFVELLEYNNVRGFVHISNVSSSWVKNIRNLVKVNQVRVAKVLNVDTAKKQIDLSFAGISPQIEKQKLTEFKQINREEKLVALLAKNMDKKFDEVWDNVAAPLMEEYDNFYKALEKIALGDDLSNLVDKKYYKDLVELVEKNITVKAKVLRGTLNLSTKSNTGVNDIKELLSNIEGKKGVSVTYEGAGKYVMLFSSSTYKESEKLMKSTIDELENLAKKLNIDFEFVSENNKK